jgi:aspartate beta-hydroxylase
MHPGANTEGFIRQAQQAMAAGRLDEAARLWEQVLAASPDHAQALFFLGQNALRRQNHVAARAFFERAALLSPQNPFVPLNLSFVCRAAGDASGEMEALTRALTIDPYFFPALLAKAMVMERLGKSRSAARIYKNALAIAPPDEHLPPEFKSQIDHARKAVRENALEMDAFLNSQLDVVRKRHPGADLARFTECKDVAIGTRKIFTQQPTMLYFPRLPAIPFYDNADFPWLAAVEAQTDAIRAELVGLLEADRAEFKPYVAHPAGAPLNQWAELNWSPRWSALYLWKDGKRIDENCARCPQTTQALAAAPMAKMAEFAPTAFFSTLDPRTRIPPHSGDTNARLIVHLPLIVPGQCFFRVGNDTREFRPGNAWIFDDSIEHEAWNDSDQLRVILIFDIWNPYLSAAERELVGGLLNGISRYYGEA